MKTILEKPLHLHGSLLPSQTHSLFANQRVLMPIPRAQSLVTGISMQRNLNSYTLDQLYTEATRACWLARGG